MTNELVSSNISATDVAKYFLYRSFHDGDLISPLKMQKLVYYAYAWTLVINKKRLFNERIEAWANGPVVPSLYQQLRHYSASPIGADFLGSNIPEDLTAPEDLSGFEKIFGIDVANTLDKVYNDYMTKTAFELVISTHSEKPWVSARAGLALTERSNRPILDNIIMEEYGQETNF